MNGASERTGPAERLSTGNPQLDQILGGGFPQNSLNIVMGQPGTGKTIFVEQMLFANAQADRPALYLTTLSEPLSKVVRYLQGFAFADQAKVGTEVIYEDIGETLMQRGIGHVLDIVRQAIRETGPSVIVIDSFKSLHDLSVAPLQMRKLVWELGGLLAAYDTTAFLVGEYCLEDMARYPEFAVADGIVEFARHGSAKRDDRFVRVLKLRGSRYAEGFHAFAITAEGLRVFPRLVSPPAAEAYQILSERIPTGLEGLDRVLGGGLWRGSNTLVMGQTGAGKTTLGLAFAIAGVRAGQPSLYASFQENPSQLARSIASLGADLDELRRSGFHLMYASPVELQIDRMVVDMFERARAQGIQRVVIDSLGDLRIATDDDTRFHDYLYALSQNFIAEQITSVMTLEVRDRDFGLDEPRLSSISDAIIRLGIELTDPPRRTLRVVKARGIEHDLAAQEMVIERTGLRLVAPARR
jgi:circadian clock protein KaiC